MRLLRQPRLALMFAGAALNEIGSWASIIAFWGYAAYRFHSSPDQIALVSVMWSAPGALFGLVSGGPIDRYGPKVVMIAADVVGFVAAVGMVWSTTYLQLVTMVTLSGTAGAFGRPAATSLAPRLVDDTELLAANALLGLTTQVALVVGPLVASVAISVWSVRAAFVVDAATFVVGALTTLPLRLRPVRPVDVHDGAGATHGSGTSDLWSGLRLAWRVGSVRRTLLVGLALFGSWGASMVMEPLYVRDVLHRSSATFGWLQTVFGLGLIVTTLLLPRLGERVVNGRAQALSVMASAGAVTLYLATSSLVAAAVGIFLWGVLTSLFLPPFYTLLQRSTPADSHGRIMATAGMANGVAGLVTTPLAGVVVAAVGVRTTALAVAAGLLAAGASGWLADQGAANSESRAAARAG
ncbi:MAG: MFS transporter [Acidobacteriota bacterium]|nr:MFS transporter [Acidobacteriota bacterium]